MSKRKRQSKKKILGKGRLNDAKKWLFQNPMPEDLIAKYSKHYRVSEYIAWEELMQIGYQDDILIQSYEKEGTQWEYKVDPLSGDMCVVPKDTEEHELYEFHPELLC